MTGTGKGTGEGVGVCEEQRPVPQIPATTAAVTAISTATTMMQQRCRCDGCLGEEFPPLLLLPSFAMSATFVDSVTVPMSCC
jgi:hypothetical protein